MLPNLAGPTRFINAHISSTVLFLQTDEFWFFIASLINTTIPPKNVQHLRACCAGPACAGRGPVTLNTQGIRQKTQQTPGADPEPQNGGAQLMAIKLLLILPQNQ